MVKLFIMKLLIMSAFQLLELESTLFYFAHNSNKNVHLILKLHKWEEKK